jgi:hypothetical protein
MVDYAEFGDKQRLTACTRNVVVGGHCSSCARRENRLIYNMYMHLAYADDVNLLGDNKDTIKKNMEILIDASKEV